MWWCLLTLVLYNNPAVVLVVYTGYAWLLALEKLFSTSAFICVLLFASPLSRHNAHDTGQGAMLDLREAKGSGFMSKHDRAQAREHHSASASGAVAHHDLGHRRAP